MRIDDFANLVSSLNIVEARQRLMRMEEISYPKMKKEEMRKTHKSIYKQAYPKHFLAKKAITTDDLRLV